jgi:peptide methionine sulfoxide reductase msrA/msrB
LRKQGFGNVVTELKSLDKFWPAEDCHQNYLTNNPNGYCPNHKTGVVFADKGKHIEKLNVTYNEHLKNRSILFSMNKIVGVAKTGVLIV